MAYGPERMLMMMTMRIGFDELMKQLRVWSSRDAKVQQNYYQSEHVVGKPTCKFIAAK